MASRPIPTPSLVVLVGPPGSGKSTWAAEHFDPRQIVSTDALRGVVGEHELDVAATVDAFELLDRIVELRLGRGLTTVVDGTGLDASRRATYLDAAARHRVASVAVRFTTAAAECRRRNRQRTHPVPTKALDQMLASARSVDLASEPWDLVLEPEPVRTVTPRLGAALATTADDAALDPTAGGLRFGLLVSRFDWPGGTEAIGPTLVRIASDAERAGFDSLWVMDHVLQIPQLGAAWDPMLESYATLAHLAAVTDRIRLGVLVSAVTLRNVGHLAKVIATLDVLSGGRAIAGLGAGSFEREHQAYGWQFPAARDRLALLEDALRALPALWGAGSRPFRGRVVTIPDTTCYPRPLQDPVPIVVGGSGERVTLRLAARYASGCNLFGDVAAITRRVGIVRDHCRDVGRDPADLEITHLGSILLGRDPRDLRDRVERLRPGNQGPQRFAVTSNAGTLDDHEAGFRELAGVGVRTAIVALADVHDPTTLATFGELIARFRG